jgi:hypothetical protein
MIVVHETSPGMFERITGARTLRNAEGKTASLRTILASSWTAEDRAKFGVHVVDPFTVPDGKRAVGAPAYEKRGDMVVEVRDLEDVPKPTPEDVASKVAAMVAELSGEHIALVGLAYPVIVTQTHITIGCETHSAEDWAAFDDFRIAAMDGLTGARFWRDHRDVILKLAGVL